MELDDRLNRFISAASTGDLVTLTACIETNIHLDDKDGKALFQALAGAHIPCVSALVDAGTPIKNKHYYAAGFGGPILARVMFDILMGPLYSRPPYPNEYTFTDADLKELYNQLKSGSLSDTQKSEYLLSAITQAHITAIRILLENEAPVKAHHFYAIGRHFDQDSPSKQNLCKRLFIILETLSQGKQLPPRFYQEEEIDTYHAATQSQASIAVPPLANASTQLHRRL